MGVRIAQNTHMPEGIGGKPALYEFQGNHPMMYTTSVANPERWHSHFVRRFKVAVSGLPLPNTIEPGGLAWYVDDGRVFSVDVPPKRVQVNSPTDKATVVIMDSRTPKVPIEPLVQNFMFSKPEGEVQTLRIEILDWEGRWFGLRAGLLVEPSTLIQKTGRIRSQTFLPQYANLERIDEAAAISLARPDSCGFTYHDMVFKLQDTSSVLARMEDRSGTLTVLKQQCIDGQILREGRNVTDKVLGAYPSGSGAPKHFMHLENALKKSMQDPNSCGVSKYEGTWTVRAGMTEADPDDTEYVTFIKPMCHR